MLIGVGNKKKKKTHDANGGQQLTGEIVQSLKGLTHKYKDLGLDPQHPSPTKLNTVGCICNACAGEAETEESLGFLTTCSSVIGKLELQ